MDTKWLEHLASVKGYFDTVAEDDPPVYRSGDNDTAPVKIVDHLQQFFEMEILKEVQNWRYFCRHSGGTGFDWL